MCISLIASKPLPELSNRHPESQGPWRGSAWRSGSQGSEWDEDGQRVALQGRWEIRRTVGASSRRTQTPRWKITKEGRGVEEEGPWFPSIEVKAKARTTGKKPQAICDEHSTCMDTDGFASYF